LAERLSRPPGRLSFIQHVFDFFRLLQPQGVGNMARFAIALGILAFGAIAVSQASLPGSLTAQAAGHEYLASNAKKEGVVTLPSGLQIETVREGQGTEQPGPQDVVMVHYR